MLSVISTCQPRPDILAGTFNPEIFTASLSQVLDYYRGKAGGISNLYTDADQFFKEATYPTQGLQTVLGEVFGRLAGDNALPAIHRLETAFGGGKTHTLIALTHLGFKGQELEVVVKGLVPESVQLPSAGAVSVIGIAGDEIPVHKPVGAALVPYTLWGEIAWQTGGEQLYREVEVEAVSFAAPGKAFFEKIFAGRKILLMLDELAQYAARLEAARPDGADQLAAFLMGLNGYARTHGGISVVITLASQTDAFSRQTGILKDLVSKVTGTTVDDTTAQGLATKAGKAVQSVVARDAIPVVPVQAAEISRVLAKRLFVTIDQAQARETADAYRDMYSKSSATLPENATSSDYHEKMVAHYPFHPTLLDYLNNKLSTVENFQGTRGVLRVLALALRMIWNKGGEIPMIHTCHLDMRDSRTVAEIISRTGSGELLAVLNADIGGVDTAMLQSGLSNAGLQDKANPHPQGLPLYEYTWKTVFLHSLVGRAEGLGTNIFGITEKETLLSVAFPGMTPPQVETALKAIESHAYYLRYRDGRYYASLEPSINLVLSRIRSSLLDSTVEELVKVSARKVVRSDVGTFLVVHDVAAPEHIPDKQTKPVLAVIDPYCHEIDTELFVTTVGVNKPRIYQNLVFLLVPENVRCKGESWSEARDRKAKEARNRTEELARDVIARRQLKAKPENHGITPAMLADDDFDVRLRERENALITTVTQTYDAIWFPSASSQVIRKDIKTGGGEGGASILEEIRRVLLQEGELITSELATSQEGVISLGKLFFAVSETPKLEAIRENFFTNRRWPVLDQASVMEQCVRAGVTRGVWCLFKFDNPESTKPEHVFSREGGEIPYNIDLAQSGWSLVSHQGATQRGWIGAAPPDPKKVQGWITAVISAEEGPIYASDVVRIVTEQHGAVPENIILNGLGEVTRAGKAMIYEGKPEQKEKPATILHGSNAALHVVRNNDVIMTPATGSSRGWVTQQARKFTISGRSGCEKLMPILSRLGNLYSKGATSTISALDLVDLELNNGGKMRISLEGAPPAAMKGLAEFFEILNGVVTKGASTEVFLEINDPEESCLLVKELTKEESK